MDLELQIRARARARARAGARDGARKRIGVGSCTLEDNTSVGRKQGKQRGRAVI